MAGFRWEQDNGIGRERKEIQLLRRQRSPAPPCRFLVAMRSHGRGLKVAYSDFAGHSGFCTPRSASAQEWHGPVFRGSRFIAESPDFGADHKDSEYKPPFPPPFGYSRGGPVLPWYHPMPRPHAKSPIFDQVSLFKSLSFGFPGSSWAALPGSQLRGALCSTHVCPASVRKVSGMGMGAEWRVAARTARRC